jgi:hypothetical protein
MAGFAWKQLLRSYLASTRDLPFFLREKRLVYEESQMHSLKSGLSNTYQVNRNPDKETTPYQTWQITSIHHLHSLNSSPSDT